MNINKNKILVCISVLLLLSIILNTFLFFHYENKYKSRFQFVSPSIAWMDTEDFLAVQKKYSLEYHELKSDIVKILNTSGLSGTYGFYFEDLSTGAWIGVNEREEFYPASLLKVPIMAAVLKKVERGELSLDQKIKIMEEDINLNSGSLGSKGAGYELTLKEILVFLIKESDNTALTTLSRRFLTQDEILEANLALGIPLTNAHTAQIGPKHYGNILRALYYSSYVRRTFSDLALSLMSDTEYDEQIPTGVPKEVPVAHKVGVYKEEGIYHDCGIIYHPIKPYLLCVMSKGTTRTEANFIIPRLSEAVYSNVDELSK